MNREDFDKILQGIVIPEGTSNEIINEKVQPIREAISEMLPSSLFRFRPCGDLQIAAFEWHTAEVLESGTLILICKDGKYEPLWEGDVMAE